jgi:hypothetical protein
MTAEGGLTPERAEDGAGQDEADAAQRFTARKRFVCK